MVDDLLETEDDISTDKDDSVVDDLLETEDDILTDKDDSVVDDIVETEDDLLNLEDDAPQQESEMEKSVTKEKEDIELATDQSADSSNTKSSYEEDDIDADLLHDEENEIDLDSPEEGDLGESNISFFEDNMPKLKSDVDKPTEESKEEVEKEATEEPKEESKEEVIEEPKEEPKEEVIEEPKTEIKEEADSPEDDSEPLEGSLKTGEISFLDEPIEGDENEITPDPATPEEIEPLDLDLIKNKFKQCQNKKEAEKVLIDILLSDILTKDCTSDNIILLVKLKESLVGSGLNQTHPCFNELKKFKAPISPDDLVQQAFTSGDLVELSGQKDCALLEGLKKISWSIDQPSSFWIMPFAPTGKKTLGAIILIDPKFKPLKDNLSYFLSSITTVFADLLRVLVIASRQP